MVFRRRDRRPIWRVVLELLWPRGGWGRAAQYVRHRVRRLPDTPQKISRGVWAGVFTSFSPFFGLHFIVSALIAVVMRGNVMASLMATFFGNPFTFPGIAWVGIATGNYLLGRGFKARLDEGGCDIGCQFANAFKDLWHNFKAIFTHERMDWHGLAEFYDKVFYPYLLGGIIPGVITATICYYLSVRSSPPIRNAAKSACAKNSPASKRQLTAAKPGLFRKRLPKS